MLTKQIIFVPLIAGVVLFGCDSEDDGATAADDTAADAAETGGQMEVSMTPEVEPVRTFEAMPDRFGLPEVATGEQSEATLRLLNTGNQPISVGGIAIEVTSPVQLLYARDESSRTTILYSYSGDDFTSDFLPLEIPPEGALRLIVQYRGSDMGPPTGQVTVTGDFDGTTLTLPIEAGGLASRVTVEPAEIDFGRIRARSSNARENLPAIVPVSKTVDVVVTNAGERPLELSGLELEGSGAAKFSLSIGDADPIADPNLFADPDGDGEPGLAAGSALTLSVTYAPSRETSDQARIVFDTNDPVVREVTIPLRGNTIPGCVEVEVDPPSDTENTIELIAEPGQTASGTVRVSACGSNPLMIDLIRLRPGSAMTVGFDDSDLPDFPATLSAVELPYEFTVSYTAPAMVRSEYRGALQILNNSPTDHSLAIDIVGVTPCTDDSVCTEGVFRCEEGRCVAIPPEELPPDTPLP